ncbi:hypothetical protein [Saccharopolyspora sp. NPDC002376]
MNDGLISGARIGLVNSADSPVRARAAERSVTGIEIGRAQAGGHRRTDDYPFARAGRIAAHEDADPLAEPFADVEYG